MDKTIKEDQMTIQPPLSKPGFSLAGDKGLLFAAVLLVIVVALSWRALGRIEKQVRFDLQEHLQRVLHTTHEILECWMMTASRIPYLVFDRPEVRQLANSTFLQQLRIIIKPLLEKHSDLGMFVVAPDGINIASMLDTNLCQKFFPGIRFWGKGGKR